MAANKKEMKYLDIILDNRFTFGVQVERNTYRLKLQ